jgi:hypothetical protein
VAEVTLLIMAGLVVVARGDIKQRQVFLLFRALFTQLLLGVAALLRQQ